MSLHEWLAGLLVLPALYHLVINWDWVVRMAPRLIAKIRATSRLNFAVDVALFLATVTVMISGIMVLPGVVSTAEGTVVLAVWQHAHKISSNLTLAAMVAHFALHAKWMSGVAARWLIPTPGRHSVRASACTGPQLQGEKLMGRHSARRKVSTRHHRTATNSMAVLLVTCLTALAVYAGIASLATAKNNEIPPPTITAAITPAADPIGGRRHVNPPAAERRRASRTGGRPAPVPRDRMHRLHLPRRDRRAHATHVATPRRPPRAIISPAPNAERIPT